MRTTPSNKHNNCEECHQRMLGRWGGSHIYRSDARSGKVGKGKVHGRDWQQWKERKELVVGKAGKSDPADQSQQLPAIDEWKEQCSFITSNNAAVKSHVDQQH